MSGEKRPLLHSIRYVAGCTALAAGIGIAPGAGLDYWASQDDSVYDVPDEGINSKEDFEKLEIEVSGHQAKLLESETDYDGLDEKFGGACLNAVLPYANGGVVQHAEEDSALNDIYQLPDQPCGNNTTKIREAIFKIREVKKEKDTLKNYAYNEKLRLVQEIKEQNEKNKSDDSLVLGMIISSSVLGGLGLISSTVSERNYRNRYNASVVKWRVKEDGHYVGLLLPFEIETRARDI